MMKTSIKIAGALALLASIVGCASTSKTSSQNVQNKESMLTAAGFKTITPGTAAQKQKLTNLPPGQIAMIQKGGKTYYVYPDAPNNRALVGGPKAYQEYKQMRAENKMAAENLAVAEMYQDSAMGWGAWGGWGEVVIVN